ncbi:MAG: N-acyl homoserine lactonase family protein [Candidatus Dormibacter sp.]
MSGQWRITALDTGTSVIEKSVITYLTDCGKTIRIPRVMWVLQGETTIVVDTSVPLHGKAAEFIGEHFERSRSQEPANALAGAGVKPNEVELVLLTHLHWDHAGNCEMFPEARVMAQQREVTYGRAPGRYFRKSFLSPLSGWPHPPWELPNLDLINGEQEVRAGIRVIPVPGHTPGSQAILVDTDRGRYAIAGDAVFSYENLERDIPPGFHNDVDHAMESMEVLRQRADHVLPSHDYTIFKRGGVATFPE